MSAIRIQFEDEIHNNKEFIKKVPQLRVEFLKDYEEFLKKLLC